MQMNLDYIELFLMQNEAGRLAKERANLGCQFRQLTDKMDACRKAHDAVKESIKEKELALAETSGKVTVLRSWDAKRKVKEAKPKKPSNFKKQLMDLILAGDLEGAQKLAAQNK